MMDDAGLRAELRKLIEHEVQQQLTQYRGVVNAELSVIGKKLKTDMEKVNEHFTSLANDILTSNKLRVAQGIEQAQGIVGTWVRAILFGAFILAGVVAAAWIAIAWTEQQFRWQVAKSAEIAERIAAQEDTLDRLNRRTGSLVLTGPDSDGHCFVLFPSGADVTTIRRAQDRPAVEVACDE